MEDINYEVAQEILELTELVAEVVEFEVVEI